MRTRLIVSAVLVAGLTVPARASAGDLAQPHVLTSAPSKPEGPVAVSVPAPALAAAKEPTDAGAPAKNPAADRAATEAPAGQQAPSKDPADQCQAGITKATTERLFATVNRPLPSGTRCKLEAVRTARTSLEVVWSLDGHELPPVRVAALLCAGSVLPGVSASRKEDGDFVINLPDQVKTSCPGVEPMLADFARVLGQEHPVLEAKPRTLRVTAYLLYGIMLGVAVAFAVRELRRKSSNDKPPDGPPEGGPPPSGKV